MNIGGILIIRLYTGDHGQGQNSDHPPGGCEQCTENGQFFLHGPERPDVIAKKQSETQHRNRSGINRELDFSFS